MKFKEQALKSKTLTCPGCGKEDKEDDFHDIAGHNDNNSLTQSWACDSCGKVFVYIYKLIDIEAWPGTLKGV